jgi:PhzF family phenazine biosynthesis protein
VRGDHARGGGAGVVTLSYWIVDAFTDRIFTGNAAAVLLPDAPLPDALMRSIAAENNLSETAFAVREGSGFHLRWFTPTVEVDLCGHATLATSFVLNMLGVAGPYHFRTRSGVVTASASDGWITLDFPARAHQPIDPPSGLHSVLGCTPVAVLQSADLIAVLDSAVSVRDLRPDSAAIKALPGGALIVTAAGGEDGADITSRYFAPAYGIEEDPVTGSLHTQVVPYWSALLSKNALLCRQASARGGVMRCTLHGERVHLTGQAVLYAKGELFLD